MNDNTGANPADVDLIWIYRESSTINTAGTADITAATSAWEGKYEGLANALTTWMVSEARYWAYEASWETHEATYNTADTSEDALKVT